LSRVNLLDPSSCLPDSRRLPHFVVVFLAPRCAVPVVRLTRRSVDASNCKILHQIRRVLPWRVHNTTPRVYLSALVSYCSCLLLSHAA